MDPFSLQDLLIFLLTAGSALVGVNFGGTMLLVVPLLLGAGYPPLTVLSSTRPAVVAQSLIGIRMFRAQGDLKGWQKVSLMGAAAAGAMVGVWGLARLSAKQGQVLMLCLTGLFILGMALRFLFRNRMSPPESEGSPQALVRYVGSGFFASIFAGLVGAGAGLVVSLLALWVLRKSIHATRYLEKFVSVGHAAWVGIWLGVQGWIDPKVALVVLLGNGLGAYLGARISLRWNALWLYAVMLLICLAVL
ncbi:MAG: sulfite exporter TauE/SafE family protein, partial [Bacteroidota bacterium]